MRVKQIWTPPETGGRSRYSMYTLGGIAAITVLSVLLVTCGVFLSAALDLPRESFSSPWSAVLQLLRCSWL